MRTRVGFHGWNGGSKAIWTSVSLRAASAQVPVNTPGDCNDVEIWLLRTTRAESNCCCLESFSSGSDLVSFQKPSPPSTLLALPRLPDPSSFSWTHRPPVAQQIMLLAWKPPPSLANSAQTDSSTADLRLSTPAKDLLSLSHLSHGCLQAHSYVVNTELFTSASRCSYPDVSLCQHWE